MDDPNLGPFKTRKDELNIEQGCVLWGIRVIVPRPVATGGGEGGLSPLEKFEPP